VNADASRHVRFGQAPLVARWLLTMEFLIALNGKISGWSGQEKAPWSRGAARA